MAYLYRHIRLDKNVPFYVGVGNDTRNYRRANDSVLRNKLWKNIVSKTSFGGTRLIITFLKTANKFIWKYK